MSEDRLIDLETKFLHLEMANEELQKTVFEQHLTIEKLEKRLNLLVDQLSGVIEKSQEIGPADEKPPHY